MIGFEAIAGKRILVTGGAGLVGSTIVDRLVRAGAGEVLVFDKLVRGRPENLAWAMENGNVRLVEGDLLDRPALAKIMEGIHVVFHQAAIRITQLWVGFTHLASQVEIVGRAVHELPCSGHLKRSLKLDVLRTRSSYEFSVQTGNAWNVRFDPSPFHQTEQVARGQRKLQLSTKRRWTIPTSLSPCMRVHR